MIAHVNPLVGGHAHVSQAVLAGCHAAPPSQPEHYKLLPGLPGLPGLTPPLTPCMTHLLPCAGASQLEVRQLRTGRMCFKGAVGGAVNNALHVGKAPNGEMRMFVCNNDETVKVYSLPSMNPLTTIRCALVQSVWATAHCHLRLEVASASALH